MTILDVSIKHCSGGTYLPSYFEVFKKVHGRERGDQSLGIVWEGARGQWSAEAQNTGNTWDGLDSMEDAIDIIRAEY